MKSPSQYTNGVPSTSWKAAVLAGLSLAGVEGFGPQCAHHNHQRSITSPSLSLSSSVSSRRRTTLHSFHFDPDSIEGGEESSFQGQYFDPQQTGRYEADEQSKDGRNPSFRHDFTSALCVVPPNSAWDALQRARHVARDSSYHEWPPAIRLFHPFDGSALEVADVVQGLHLESFQITLDQWTIIPHVEAIEAQWLATQSAASQDFYQKSAASVAEQNDQDKVEELIAKEEQIGKGKWIQKMHKAAASASIQKTDAELEAEYYEFRRTSGQTAKINKSPEHVLAAQKEQYDEFNGPCLICLEPDEESRFILQELRETLQDCMDHTAYFSVASVYSWNDTQIISSRSGNTLDENTPDSYRPVVPIAAFPTITAAMRVARTLKGLWEPLTFNVADLHVISCRDTSDGADAESLETVQAEVAASSAAFSSTAEAAISLSSLKTRPWGCNSKIMLVGEEMEQDDEINQDMVNKLTKEGVPGGMDLSFDITILDDEEVAPGESELESFLSEDDDYDEGISIVIGRTQFLTGEKRTYPNMPASSQIDGKDRMHGEEGGPVSGAARRRSTLHRDGTRWNEGEFGRKETDLSPWTRQSRNKRKKKAALEGEDRLIS